MSRACVRGSIGQSRGSMPDRLLDRQVKLLEHLTGAAAIFAADRGALLDGSLEGIDRGPLHLEARLSHEKRMVKIESVLSRTLDLLGGKRAQIIREFVEACPPASINRLENARRFHGFLLARWEREAPEPAFLPDVASFELTYAAVRAGDRAAAAATETSGVLHAPHGAIRRHRNVAVLRCAHDIRPILEGRTDEASPARDETCFAVMARVLQCYKPDARAFVIEEIRKLANPDNNASNGID